MEAYKANCRGLVQVERKKFLFKTQISLIFSCVHFSKGKIPRVLKGVQKKIFAPKKKKKEKSGGAKNIFAPPQKKKKFFWGEKNFLRGDFRLQQGFSGFSSAPQQTQPSTTRWLSHSQCVKVVLEHAEPAEPTSNNALEQMVLDEEDSPPS